MATAADLRRLALALPGTVERPHFDRRAFRVARTYATLAADGLTANLAYTPDEQALKCTVAPEAFAPVPNAFGTGGWTTVTLAALSPDELAAALETAWRHAVPARRGAGGTRPRSRSPE
ncbi:MAG: MmcQ/YjbR family DNA-binding protein [Rhodovulum sp.]|nr:MmcQ/YjbR family DNA-binding protein [Rhodovulum sp.]